MSEETPTDPSPADAGPAATADAPPPKKPQLDDPTPAAPTAPASFPEDWRALMAGDNEKVAEQLRRFSDPTAVATSLHEATRKLSERDSVQWETEDVAGLRKKLGVPEKLDDYGVKPPRADLSEGEQQVFDAFREHMHGANLTPAQAQKLTDVYFDMAARDQQSLQEAAVKKTTEAELGLKQLWGSDYQRNVTAAAMVVDQYTGEEGRESISSLVLADGTYLGDNPEFLKMMAQIGRNTLDDTDLSIAEVGGSTGVNPSDEMDQLIQLQFSDPVKYASKETQDKLNRLAEMVSRMKEREINGG